MVERRRTKICEKKVRPYRRGRGGKTEIPMRSMEFCTRIAIPKQNPSTFLVITVGCENLMGKFRKDCRRIPVPFAHLSSFIFHLSSLRRLSQKHARAEVAVSHARAAGERTPAGRTRLRHPARPPAAAPRRASPPRTQHTPTPSRAHSAAPRLKSTRGRRARWRRRQRRRNGGRVVVSRMQGSRPPRAALRGRWEYSRPVAAAAPAALPAAADASGRPRCCCGRRHHTSSGRRRRRRRRPWMWRVRWSRCCGTRAATPTPQPPSRSAPPPNKWRWPLGRAPRSPLRPHPAARGHPRAQVSRSHVVQGIDRPQGLGPVAVAHQHVQHVWRRLASDGRRGGAGASLLPSQHAPAASHTVCASGDSRLTHPAHGVLREGELVRGGKCAVLRTSGVRHGARPPQQPRLPAPARHPATARRRAAAWRKKTDQGSQRAEIRV